MNKRSSDFCSDAHCDFAQLDALLSGKLPEVEMERVELHLSSCPGCAEHLEAAAILHTSWEEATSLLADDEYDSPKGSTSVPSLFLGREPRLSRSQAADVVAREIRGWLDPTDDPQSLGRFAGYEIIGIVGHGGMGIVLKGFEASLNRFVAIKVLAPRLATNGSARKRFAREAQAAAAVRHDNVIAIHRVDDWHGLPFLVMPYLGGISLQRRLDAEGPLSIEQALRVSLQIAAGLAAAHAQGLVHRDIKPANILLEQGVERVTITDFGLARAADDASLTRTGVIAGTPQYMSPEQAEAKPLDARSDLFSLGSVIYAMLTGRTPFRGESSFEVLTRIIREPARAMQEIEPSVPTWIERLVAKLHSKQPQDRFQSATEVALLLETCLAHVRQPATSPLPPSLNENKLSQSGKRRPPIIQWIGAITIAMLFALVGILIVLETNKGTTIQRSRNATTGLPSLEVTEVGKQTEPSSVESSLLADKSLLDWEIAAGLLGPIVKELEVAEKRLLETGTSVEGLMNIEKRALSKGGPIVHTTIKSWTKENGKGPKPGDLIDLCVAIHYETPEHPEVVPVLRHVRVIGIQDEQPDSSHDRLVAIELELTQIELERVRSYASRDSFTFFPSRLNR